MNFRASFIHIGRLEVRDLRNLEDVSLDFIPSTNVLCGDNGQGKTSLLEAIYWVATTRSFRTHRLRELIRHGTVGCSVRAMVVDAIGEREHLVGLSHGQRLVRIDGQKPSSAADYAVRTPVVIFHPGELTLTMGPALGRRTLLDRVALFMDPRSYEVHSAYVRAMRARQHLLRTEGMQAAGLEAYEQLMVRHGVELTRHRSQVVRRLMEATKEAFVHIAPEAIQLSARYACGGSLDEDQAKDRLFSLRNADSHRSWAGFGPHRDDLLFELNGCPVRTDASQGQHRLLTLSLKLAEMQCIAEASGIRPLLLLDDVSSELDAGRTEAFFELLGKNRDQVFLTTTRPEMLPLYERRMGESKVFKVDSGTISQMDS